MVGIILGWLLTIGMTLLGVVTCIWPLPTSRLYGVPLDDALGAAWVRAAGLRDLGIALALAILLCAGSLPAAAAVAFATGGVAVGDFTSVAALRGRAAALPLVVHASGVGMGFASAALLSWLP